MLRRVHALDCVVSEACRHVGVLTTGSETGRVNPNAKKKRHRDIRFGLGP